MVLRPGGAGSKAALGSKKKGPSGWEKGMFLVRVQLDKRPRGCEWAKPSHMYSLIIVLRSICIYNIDILGLCCRAAA